MGDLAHEFLHAFYCRMGAFTFTAGVAVVNENTLPPGFKMQNQQVVNNPVPEIGREDFAFFGAFGNKAGGRKGAIGTGLQFLSQLHQIFLGIHLKPQGNR